MIKNVLNIIVNHADLTFTGIILIVSTSKIKKIYTVWTDVPISCRQLCFEATKSGLSIPYYGLISWSRIYNAIKITIQFFICQPTNTGGSFMVVLRYSINSINISSTQLVFCQNVNDLYDDLEHQGRIFLCADVLLCYSWAAIAIRCDYPTRGTLKHDIIRIWKNFEYCSTNTAFSSPLVQNCLTLT